MVEPALVFRSFYAVKSVLSATYHIRCDARAIEARARTLAVEQSVEMPVEAIDDEFVLREVLGHVEAIKELETGLFEVHLALGAETIGSDAGQLLNMLFGNSSLHEDVVLQDFVLPPDLEKSFGGPLHGLAGLRTRVGAGKRALTCSALKPQGLPLTQLGDLARRFADGGVDYIKDDHGFADQTYAPFAQRVAAVAKALAASGGRTIYIPSLSGDLDTMRRQIAVAADLGISAAMVTPMVAGVANFHRLVRDHPGFAFFAHPSLAGAARIAPAPLFGKLFRAFGADALVFPNYGGRFGYTPQICAAIAHYSGEPRNGLAAAVPVPAGGLQRERIPELLDFYGADVMLLIGGALLATREKLTEATAAFVAAVEAHPYD
jgi:ribulose-bisphosphate carboxylase large chain